MWIFGHLGIGYEIVRQQGFQRSWSRRTILVGTLLPDLIDKPLYLAGMLITGQKGSAIGLISGTRTFGHTALFLIILVSISSFSKTRLWGALSLGVATHLFLDLFSKISSHRTLEYVTHSLLWPAFGSSFPGQDLTPIHKLSDLTPQPIVAICEILGGWLLWRELTKRKSQDTLKK
jgi:hypothetical protein